MPSGKEAKENRFQLLGWLFFLVCSLFFIADSLTSRSLLGLIGSAVFFVGCIVFLVPFAWKKGDRT